MTEEERLEAEYTVEFQGWNWPALRNECMQSAMAIWQEAETNASWYDVLECEGTISDGQIIGATCVGRMPWPSGKYYMPWATSNLNPCPYCQGSGHSPEVKQCQVCNGQGTRTFSELAKLRNGSIAEARERMQELGAIVGENDFQCLSCRGAGMVKGECEYCGGHGCQEAYHDMIWSECLETEADRHGMWSGNCEHDPTDMMLYCWIDLAQLRLIKTVQGFLDHTTGYRALKDAAQPFVWGERT